MGFECGDLVSCEMICEIFLFLGFRIQFTSIEVEWIMLISVCLFNCGVEEKW